MELNYYQELIKIINQTYLTLRMEADLPWTNQGQKFVKQYLNLKAISEVEQLVNELNEVDKAIKLAPTVYNVDLIMTFNQQFFTVELGLKLLTQIHHEFNVWSLNYNEKNLLEFQQFLFSTFQNNLEYLSLNYKNLFLKHQSLLLFQYLSSLEKQFLNQKVEQTKHLLLMSNFYFEINDSLQKMKEQLLSPTILDQAFFLDLQRFSLKMKLLLSLYYRWLNSNQIVDETTVKYASFYAY